MRLKLKHIAQNMALALASLLAVLVLLEFVVFGLILKPDDPLSITTINSVVRYEPMRQATFRHPDGRQSHVTINRDGWNSSKPRYELEKPAGRLRIAVIGDSYVHASYVDTRQAFPEVIERRLAAQGIDAEVLRFGVDGAPLSQYLHVLRTEVADYSPDVVLVQLIHNDFDESYRFLKTRYGSSFMKIGSDEAGRLYEIPPVDYEPSFADLLRTSATFRYLYYETNLYLSLRSLVSRYVWGGKEDYDPANIVSGVDVRHLDDTTTMARVTAYVLDEMKSLSARKGFRLALSIDAVRETIYGRADAATARVEALIAMTASAAQSAQLPLLDLTAMFMADYEKHKTRFEYSYDWHWNERANELVGNGLADWIINDPRLLGVRPGASKTPEPPPAPRG